MDPLKHFEIVILRHIRFAELRKIQIEQPNFMNKYNPTCIKQAPKGLSKSACLRQVLAEYGYLSMYLPVSGTEYMLAKYRLLA